MAACRSACSSPCPRPSERLSAAHSSAPAPFPTEGPSCTRARGGERPSGKYLALLGVIGGAPTFFGTIVGQAWTSEALSVLFLALAAGSILYVVLQLVKVMQRAGHAVLVSWMVLAGLLLGFGTELILKAAGI